MTIQKFLSACACALVAFSLFSVNANAVTYGMPEGTVITSKAVYLYNLDTDTEILAQNAQEQLPPASTAKIMTCILALENTSDLDTEMVKYPNFSAMNEFMSRTGLSPSDVSQADVQVGEELSMRKALYCLMLQSDCYSAYAIAENVCDGDVDAFIGMMNAKAQELGAVNTHFTNPHGLYEPEMVTTAYDLALITRYAIRLDSFMDICSTTTVDIAPTNVARHAAEYRLISTVKTMIKGSPYYYEPIKGVKTGTLPEVGMNYVSTASRDGYNYLLVLMGAPAYDADGAALPDKTVFTDAKTVYEWAFDTFLLKTLYEKGSTVGQIKVNLSDGDDFVDLQATESYTALVPVSTSETEDGSKGFAMRLNVPESIDAPITAGEKIGTMDVIVYGDIAGSIELVAKKSLTRSQSKYILSWLQGIVSEFWVKFVVILVVLVAGFYITLMVLRNRYRKRYRRARGRRK